MSSTEEAEGQWMKKDLEVGEVQWHSSEEDGGPDVGIMIGIGKGKALWWGELATQHGLGDTGFAIYQSGDAEYLPFDYESVRAILEYHIAPLLRSAARAKEEGVRAGIEAAADHLAELAKRTPLGHENHERGRSTHNWLRCHEGLIRALDPAAIAKGV